MDVGLRERALAWLDGSFEILFPRECLVCTRPLRGRSLCFRCTPDRAPNQAVSRCYRCFGALLASSEAISTCHTCLTLPPPTFRMRYLWEYEGLARDLIRSMKYQPSITLTRMSGAFVRDALPQLFDDDQWDLIVPIPSSPHTLRKRLFHPCHEMAKVLAPAVGSPTILPALRHNRKKAPQATLSHEERLRGLRHFFVITRPQAILGKRILLVEDVITTGATIAAAAHALERGGAARVDVVALAQARVWARFRHRLYRIFENA